MSHLLGEKQQSSCERWSSSGMAPVRSRLLLELKHVHRFQCFTGKKFWNLKEIKAPANQKSKTDFNNRIGNNCKKSNWLVARK